METIDTSAATLAETLRGPGRQQARADLESEFQAAAKPFADDNLPPTELETWAAEIDAAAAAARLLAWAIQANYDALELEGSAQVLAGRLEHIAEEVGKIGQLHRAEGFRKAGAT